MFLPISDDNPTLRAPIVTVLLLIAIAAVWLFIQGAGLDPYALAASVCDLGLVPGELTGRAPEGLAVPMGDGLACVVDRARINILTPITSMFLHGGWFHVIFNCLFLWIFGNNVEDSMGRLRFLAFYLICGLAAAAGQIILNTASPVPMVGASGAIAGALGAYLVLYPRAQINILVVPFVFLRFKVPAWAMLIYWIGGQLVELLPQLTAVRPDVASGTAYGAHIGGFVAGLALVKLFENTSLVRDRLQSRHRLQYRW